MFSHRVIDSLGDLTDTWLTINEPVILAITSYLLGTFPPRETNVFHAFKCVDNLAEAHMAAYEEIHRVFADKCWGRPKVGFAKHIRCFNPYNPNSLLDKLAVSIHERIFNRDFFDRITKKKLTLDIMCINYYTSELVKFPMDRRTDSNLPKNKLGWDIYPEGLYQVLKRYWDIFHLPIYVTENGVCDENDELRPAFILDHVYQMHRAIESGVDVRAYCHWATMDNFEYNDGFSTRFGLIYVDHASMGKNRVIKPSGRLFGELAKANGIVSETVSKFKPDWNQS
jgi:beta-glucosidase